ncbi:MAG TPA: DUF2628 domain-containing protein [Xanthobacteraceae bacterium]|jgi:hypothetical protein|nr:DUF2628 domain-containing protein [Xanthobacteraceae bacterium]
MKDEADENSSVSDAVLDRNVGRSDFKPANHRHWLEALLADPTAAMVVGPNFDRLAQKWLNCFHYLDKPEALTWHSSPFSVRGIGGKFSWENVQSFIWPAILGPYWLVYRRLYVEGAVLFGIYFGCALLLPQKTILLNVILAVLCLNFGPALYLRRVRDTVSEVNGLSSAEDKAEYISRRGKTSWPAPVVAIGLVAITSYLTDGVLLGDRTNFIQTDVAHPRELSTGNDRSAVSACNDRDVINTLVEGTLGRYKTAARNLLNLPGTYDESVFKTVDTLSASISSISQMAYDPTNGVRTCGAVFGYSTAGDLSLIDAITPLMRLDPNVPSLCPRQVTYQVRRLLDKPGQFQIQWQCD